MEYNRRVIAVSLDCIKSLIVKLDRDGDLGCDGVEYVMSQFSPSEAADSPLDMLDSLILYLFHIHRVDWYSRTWHVGSASSLTVREERGIVVTAADEEELVEEKILELKERTKMFLKPAEASQEPEDPPFAARRTEHEERLVGSSYSFAIEVKPVDGTRGAALIREQQTFVLSSSRLEDLVGAVAVAVPPGEGIGGVAGATAVHPLTGMQIPVVTSTTVNGLVNPGLGPSHYQLCRELGLPLVSSINPEGMVAEGHGVYDNLSRGAAATLVKEQLQQCGAYRGEQNLAEDVLLSPFGEIVEIQRQEGLGSYVSACKPDNLRCSVLMVSRPSDDTIVSFSADMNVSAVDNKVTAEFTGRTGAFCTACKARSTDMHGPRAAEVYYMDFDIEQVNNNYLALVEKCLGDKATDGTLPSAKGDYDKRLGQKQQPLTTMWDPTKVLSVLHASVLNLVKWLFNLQCRVAAGCLQWNPGKRLPLAWKSRLDRVTKDFHNQLGPILGFLGKNAPNQLPGNLARLYLAEGNRDAVVNMLTNLGTHCPDSGAWRKLTEHEADTYRSIIRDLGIIGRVASSSRLIRVFVLREFCSQVHCIITNAFPWCLLGESVHRLLDHIWELCLLNNCHGLARYNESGCESVHKVEMYDREHQARKTSLLENVTDVFTHQNASSDPCVRTFDTQPRCMRCGSGEHHTVSCPTKEGVLVLSGSDDNIFNSLIVLDGEEEPMEQKEYLAKLKKYWQT